MSKLTQEQIDEKPWAAMSALIADADGRLPTWLIDKLIVFTPKGDGIIVIGLRDVTKNTLEGPDA